MAQTMIEWHVGTVFALTGLVVLNLIVLVMQKKETKLKKYLRIQATVWTTLMSMIVFSGAVIMAYTQVPFSIKIDVMIVAAVMLSFLELRRHIVLKKSRPDQACFAKAKAKILRYYVFQLLWLLMVGALAPRL